MGSSVSARLLFFLSIYLSACLRRKQRPALAYPTEHSISVAFVCTDGIKWHSVRSLYSCFVHSNFSEKYHQTAMCRFCTWLKKKPFPRRFVYIFFSNFVFSCECDVFVCVCVFAASADTSQATIGVCQATQTHSLTHPPMCIIKICAILNVCYACVWEYESGANCGKFHCICTNELSERTFLSCLLSSPLPLCRLMPLLSFSPGDTQITSADEHKGIYIT